MRPFDEFCKQFNAEFIYKTYEDFATKFRKDIKPKYFNSSNIYPYLFTTITLEGIYKKARCYMTIRFDNINAESNRDWVLSSSSGSYIVSNSSDWKKIVPIVKAFLPSCSVVYMSIVEISDSYKGLSNNPASHFAMNPYAAYEAYDLTASISALSKLGLTKDVGDTTTILSPAVYDEFIINTLTDLDTETFGGTQMETFYMNGNRKR